MINSYQKSTFEDDDQSLLYSGEPLKKGIWPRSVPLWMAAFYVALFIIRPWERLFPWLGAIHFERVYALCMIAAVIFSKKTNFKMTSQTTTVLLFFVAVSISAILAFNSTLAWQPYYKFFALIIFYFVILMVIRSPYNLVFIIICYIVSMAAYLAKAQWEFFIYGHHRYDMGVIRMVGIENTFGGPNNLAMSIVVSLPMGLFLWKYRTEISSLWPGFWRNWFPRFIIIYFCLAITSIIFTNSRSGFVSLVLFLAMVGFSGKGVGKKIGYMLIVAFILLLAWQFIPEENKGRFRTIWAPESGPKTAQVSAQGRIEGFKAGIKMFQKFPISGVGTGNFIEYRLRYVDGVPLNAHSLYGQVLGETGLLGGITFFLVVSVSLINCRKVKNLTQDYPDFTLKILSAISLAIRNAIFLLAFEGLFAHNLFRFNWFWLAAFSTLAFQFASRYQYAKKTI